MSIHPRDYGFLEGEGTERWWKKEHRTDISSNARRKI